MELRRKFTGLFTGIEFEIRRVRLLDYMREIGSLPAGIVPSVAEQLRKFADDLGEKAGDPEHESRSVRLFLSKGVVRPKIWVGDESECPEGQIPVDDLGTDSDLVARKVAEFSFYMPGLEDLDKFFRGPGAGAAGPGSEEVLGQAIGDAGQEADAAGGPDLRH